jgi:hypothetical protein
MNCNKCGAENDGASNYCQKCGERLVRELFCAKCGKPLKPDLKFCVECGTQIDLPVLTSVIYPHAEAEEKYWNVDESGGLIDVSGKTFGIFLSKHTWWWIPILLVSFLLIGQGAKPYPNTNVLIIVVMAIWLTYKYSVWKKWAKGTEIITQAPSQQLRVGRLLLVIFFSAIAAYIVASGPDNKSYFHDLPYQAALEKGYSPAQAEEMIPRILQVKSLLNSDAHTGLFYTFTGWLWFLILSGLYSWRGYRLLVSSKNRSDKPNKYGTSGESED